MTADGGPMNSPFWARDELVRAFLNIPMNISDCECSADWFINQAVSRSTIPLAISSACCYHPLHHWHTRCPLPMVACMSQSASRWSPGRH